MDSLLEPEDRLREQYLRAPWGEIGRSATLGVVSLFSSFLLRGLNTTTAVNLDEFNSHVLHRSSDVGLITVSNHTSTLDDPMLFSAILPWSFFLTEHTHGKVRWSLCAREICYSNPLLGQFFQSGKTLPIERGAGPGQPIMRIAAAEVSRGGWVHLFPEGRINYTGQLGPLRWGIGKVFCDAVNSSTTTTATATTATESNTPIVLPFYHSGMGSVLPRKGRFPRVGQTVVVTVGRPIYMDDLAARCKSEQGEGQKCVWKEVAERVGEALRALEKVSPPNVDQVPGNEEAEMKRRSEGAMPA